MLLQGTYSTPASLPSLLTASLASWEGVGLVWRGFADVCLDLVYLLLPVCSRVSAMG